MITQYHQKYQYVISNEGLLLIYSGALTLFLLFALPEYSLSNRLLAWVVFLLDTYPALRLVRTTAQIPILEFALLNYVIFFALPLFFKSNALIYQGEIIPVPTIINETLIYVLMAIVALLAGNAIARKMDDHKLFPSFQIASDPSRLFWIGVAMVFGNTFLNLGIISIPASVNRPVNVLLSANLGIALLAILHYSRDRNSYKDVLSLCCLLLVVILGFSSGMTQSAIQPLVIWYLCKWLVTRKIPFRAMLLGASLFFLLQPVKMEYRAFAWRSTDIEVSIFEKVAIYTDLTLKYWLEAITTPTTIIDELNASASQRLSLLLSTSRYIELTPEVHDFTDGESILYMVYTWIPRFIWPSKPIAQEANAIYPIKYGLQHPNTFSTARFGVGHVAETYINFGVLGIIPVFFVLGIFYYIPLALLSNYKNGDLASLAILAVVTIDLMLIGSTIGNAFGSVIQQLLVQCLVLRILTSHKPIFLRKHPHPLPSAD